MGRRKKSKPLNRREGNPAKRKVKAPKSPTRGRKKTPTRKAAAAGNPGKRALNRHELTRSPEDPQCPEYLDDHAAKIFFFLVDELRRDGILARVDSMQLGSLAQAYSIKIQAYEQWAKTPITKRLTIKTKSGYVQPNPLLGIMNTQAAVIQRIAPEYGLSPSSRAALDIENRFPINPNAPPVEVPKDPLEAALSEDGPAAAGLKHLQ